MTNNKIDAEIKLRYPPTDLRNTLESIGFRNGATWAFEEVKLALAEKEKDIETLKNRLENSYKSTDTTVMQMRDLINYNLEKEKQIGELQNTLMASSNANIDGASLIVKQDLRIKQLEEELKTWKKN